MRKTAFIITLLLVLFFIAGCKGGSKSSPGFFEPFAGGMEGISIKFQEGLPPNQIYDNGKFPFSVGLEIENRGEYNFESASNFGKIKLSGFHPEYFGNPVTKKEINFDLAGRKKNFEGTILDGTKEYMTFEDFNYKLDIQGNDFLTIRAEICYDYQTKTHTKICIKENTFDNKNDDLCKVNEMKNPKNSGAPVHVSALTEIPMGKNKIQVLFTVSHVGSGQIYKKNTICDNSITNTDKNKVYAKVGLPEGSNAKINCPQLIAGTGGQKTEGFITLYDGEPVTVTCTIETPDGNNVYEPVLYITLDYLYGQTLDKKIEILDVSTN